LTFDKYDHHFATIKSSNSETVIREHLRALLDEYPVVSFGLLRGNTFWRGRKAGAVPFKHISELSYPPPQSTKLGRLNEEAKPSLYAALRRETALREISAVEGDYVQLIGFRVKPEHTIGIAVIGELFHIFKTGYTKAFGFDPYNSLAQMVNLEENEKGLRLIYIDAFLGSIIADKDAQKNGYTATRQLASMIYQDTDADGLFYPSVLDVPGINIAIRPEPYDLKTHIVCSQFIRITKLRDFNFFEYETLLEASNIDSNGNFLWCRPSPNGAVRFFGLSKLEQDVIKSKPANEKHML
jgi:RES domain-containing protein